MVLANDYKNFNGKEIQGSKLLELGALAPDHDVVPCDNVSLEFDVQVAAI